jgi:hypothetical protein
MKNNLEAFLNILGFTAVFVILLGFPLQLLWNWLMPDIFNLPRIGFWQAVGLNVLSSILFGSAQTTLKES